MLPRVCTRAAILLAIAGCASQPRPGSLQALDQQARRESWNDCMDTQLGDNRYVPLAMLAGICARVVLQRHGRPGH